MAPRKRVDREGGPRILDVSKERGVRCHIKVLVEVWAMPQREIDPALVGVAACLADRCARRQIERPLVPARGTTIREQRPVDHADRPFQAPGFA